MTETLNSQVHRLLGKEDCNCGGYFVNDGKGDWECDACGKQSDGLAVIKYTISLDRAWECAGHWRDIYEYNSFSLSWEGGHPHAVFGSLHGSSLIGRMDGNCWTTPPALAVCKAFVIAMGEEPNEK